MRYLTLTIAALILAGCATRTTFVCPELPEPSRPQSVTLDPGSLSCVSDDAAERLAERERRIIEYAETIETIIKTHNRNCRGSDG